MDPADELAAAISSWQASRPTPLFVAIDGRSGSGKSTLAAEMIERVGAVVIEGDDFYRGGTAEFWDTRSAEEKVRHVMDWERQRALLSELRAGNGTTWFPFDWEAFDGRLSTTSQSCEPADVIILEGAYSCRPELADLIDASVLLNTPEPIRSRWLRQREGDEYSQDWEGRWREAEDHYFSVVMPMSAFDLVVGTDREF